MGGHGGSAKSWRLPVISKRCSATVTVTPERKVRCTGRAGHGPAEDMHQGLLRVTLPDGREHGASLVWGTTPSPWDDEHLKRAT